MSDEQPSPDHTRNIANDASLVSEPRLVPPPPPPRALRLQIIYDTTNLRIAGFDKPLVDRAQVRASAHLGRRVPQHELFTHILLYSLEHFDEILARWAARASTLAEERAMATARSFLDQRRGDSGERR